MSECIFGFDIIFGFLQFYIEKSISTGSHFIATFCWSINCMSSISLNYKTYSRHFHKLKYYLHLQLFNLFSFKESSSLSIKHDFRFFWSLNYTSLVCRLYVSIWTILDFWAVFILEVFYSGIF